LIGIAVAAPVGAMGVLCIQRTLSKGFSAGLATGSGIATADGAYAGVAAFGLAAVSHSLVAFQSPLRIVGGVLLVWLGWRAMFRPPARSTASDTGADRGGWALYASAVGLTLTNPMTIMAFGAVFASAGLSVQPTLSSAVVATAGVALGSFSWWAALSATVALMRHAVKDSTLTWVGRISGGAIVVFGLLAIGAGVMALMGS
jgi:putative LysE/RhtB family amino acid efflux pump